MVKFDTTPKKNKLGQHLTPDFKRGEHAAVLHTIARLGMAGAVDLVALHGLNYTSACKLIQLLSADNTQYIRLVPWQAQRKGVMFIAQLFYELTARGEAENVKRNVPNYMPVSGSDFEHRAQTVRWLSSFYAGLKADEHAELIEWPAILERLEQQRSSTIAVNGVRVQTDTRPFGVKREGYTFTRGPEIEMGTNTKATIDAKLINHATIFRDRLFHKELGLPNDIIPFVSVSEKGKERIMERAQHLLATGKLTHKELKGFCFGVLPMYDTFTRDHPLDHRAYTMPYERIGYPEFYFNA